MSPRLFNTTGTIKSTKAVLFEFSAVFMAGMGDFARAIFLSCGYECAASQSPLDEFDFSVKDLGNDFRDGVRLCALADRPEIFKKVLYRETLPFLCLSRQTDSTACREYDTEEA